MLNLLSRKARSGVRYVGFSVQRGGAAVELNIDHVDTARTLFLKHQLRRYRPLVALLRSAFRRPVLIVADGEAWRRTHEAILPHLMARPVEQRYTPVIEAVAQETFADLAQASAASEPTAAVEIAVESQMRVITSRILGFVLFGQTLSPAEARFVDQTLDVATQAPGRGLSSAINGALGLIYRALGAPERQPVQFPRPQRRALDALMAWIGRKVATAPSDTPLLASLQARYADLRPAGRKRAVAAEYAMMFIAGVETTAAALTFALAEIAAAPDIQAAVVAEARRPETPDGAQEPLARRLPYIWAVVQETLRRHTIVPTMLREAAEDHQIVGKRPGAEPGPVTIKRGSILRYLPVLNHMRRSLWKDPYRFDPTRYDAPLSREQKKVHHPFGMGAQACPGRTMATTEAVLILRALFQHLDVAHRPLLEPVASERNAVFTVRPLGVKAMVSAAGAIAGMESKSAPHHAPLVMSNS